MLAANSLHFVRRRGPVLAAIRAALAPGGRLVVVEYDADSGNPWVPHPFSFATWRTEAPAAGFAEPELLHRVPSRFLGGDLRRGYRGSPLSPDRRVRRVMDVRSAPPRSRPLEPPGPA